MKFFLVLILFMATVIGCSEKTINDDKTPESLPKIEKPDNHEIIYEFRDDQMISPSLEGDFGAGKKMVIDLNYYKGHEISRGDVVYFKTNEDFADYLILRVLGLPDEKFKIKKGQVYINGEKLNAFYGNQNYAMANTLKGDSLKNTDEIKIPEDQYFLTGDLWDRSHFFGTYSRSDIHGKVVGVLKQSGESSVFLGFENNIIMGFIK